MPRNVTCHFDTVTDCEVTVMSVLATSRPLDHISTWLLKKLASFVVPVIRHLCNLSLQSGTFPQCLKEAMVYPCIKNPTWIQSNSDHTDQPQTYLTFLRLLSEWLPNASQPMSMHHIFFWFISLLTVHITVRKQQFCLSTTLWSTPLMTAKCLCSCYLILVRHSTLLIMTFCCRF